MKYIFPIILTVFSVLVFIGNFTSGTYLTGWDNLQSELNLPLNIGRSLSVGWQEYQGLGLVGGMGHGANLVREVILAVSTIVLDTSFVRYFWHFSMLLVGPLGVYYFLRKVVGGNSPLITYFSAFTGAVFYLLNLATVQYFLVPFEAFSAFYGFLPWLLYVLVNYYENPSKKSLLLLFVVTLLATPAFIVQTLFVVYLVLFGFITLNHLINKKKKSFKNVTMAVGIVLSANLFWLLPVAYFSLTNVSVVDNAKINSIASPETLLQNEDFGGIENISRLKGFWFEYLDYQNGNFDRMLTSWESHLESPFIDGNLQFLFVIAILGIISALFIKANKWKWSGALIFGFAIFMLTSGRDPFGVIFDFFSNTIPLFGQIFRSPFTKWSIVLAIAFAWGIGNFTAFIANIFPRRKEIAAMAMSGYITLFLLISFLPIFSGGLISKEMKLEFPEAYSELYGFMEKKPKESRIAFFPIQSFWGWNFTDWPARNATHNIAGGGYRGSGFLWYGIEQPILDRAFDVWSKNNETFYHEASTAFYSQNGAELAKVFSKYDVSYVLLDESVIIPGGVQEQLRYDYIKQVMPQIGGEVVWQEDFLTVYKLASYDDQFVQTPNAYSLINTYLSYTREDSLYSNFGDYINSKKDGAHFPFSFLSKEDLSDEVSFTDGTISMTSDVSITQDRNIYIPGFDGQFKAPASISLLNGQILLDFQQPYTIEVDGKILNREKTIPTLTAPLNTNIRNSDLWINGENVQLADGKTNRVEGIPLNNGQGVELKVYNTDSFREVPLSENFYGNRFDKCWEREGQTGFVETSIVGDVYSIRAQDAVGCNSMQLGRLVKDAQVTISLPYRSGNGARPHFCLQKEGSSECLHGDVFYLTPASSTWTSVTRKVLIPDDGNYWLVVMGRPPDETGAEWEIEYKVPRVTLNAQLSSVSFVPEIFNSLWQEKRYVIPAESKSITVELPSSSNKVDFSLFRADNNFNCDVLKRGFADKVFRGGKLFYSAEDYGAICDFATVGLSTDGEYLMRIQGENKAGRSLKAFLYNGATQRNDMELLMDEGTFDNSFSVLSWPQEPGEYSLTLETRSFGQLSRNEVTGVTFYNFPISWLSQWRIGDVEKIDNRLQILDTNKTGTALYRVKASGSGLLRLSQGYDEGWLAFSPSNGFLEHVKVNSWANGWMVPDSGLPVTDYEVIIFFWPQLLQWFGFGVLIVTPVAILKHRSKLL